MALLFFENYIVCCYFLLNLYYLQVFTFAMGENINIRTVKELKAYLYDKIDKLACSESISDIKALVQEQSNLILKLTETVNSQKERIDKLEESLIECENSLEVSKTVSSRLVKKCDDLEQYGRRLCLRILDVDGDDSETSDDVFDKCTELFNKLELDIPGSCIDRVHRIGKKTPVRVRPIIVRFTTWRHPAMVYRKRKDCVNCRITLDLTKTRMGILKEATDLARESHHISHAFPDINFSLCVKLTNGSFKFFNTIDDLNNL